MILTLRYRWKGRLRATLREVVFRCQSLINWNDKNPSQALLTNADEIQLKAAISICNAKLAQKEFL